jgi:thymidylate kinase
MLLALEGIAGAGKSTLRDRLLRDAHEAGIRIAHTGQFSWLAPSATRTLIRIRAGIPADTLDEAVEAACWDLSLHARFNLSPLLHTSHLLADRLTLSSACLLALVHDQPVEQMIHRLAEQTRARPGLTLLLTTPLPICESRIAERATARRFGEDSGTAARLADLYLQAAAAWTTATGLPVLQHPCTTPADLDQLARCCLALVKGTATGPYPQLEPR